MTAPMWKHQETAVKAAEIVQDLGLFFEQGTGKTRAVIEILRRKYARVGRIRRTLILCPVIVCHNWRDEILKFSKIPASDILVLVGPARRRVNRFIQEALGKNKIVITNYEGLQMERLVECIDQWGPEILVCDESQRLKNHESIRAKQAAKIAERTEHNYVLTGTPILNSPADIFMQFRVLDRGDLFGRNFYAFRASYFEDSNSKWKGKQGYFPKWECAVEKYDELQKKISTKALRVLKKDCLDLPPLVRTQVHAPLSPEQTKAYKEMYNEFVTFIESKSGEPRAVVAQLAVTKALKLQQIVTGFVNDEFGNPIRFNDVPRLKVLAELLEDLTPSNKVIVWAVFKENYKQIAELCEGLGIKYTELHGALNPIQKRDQMELFRKDPDVRVMIANQGAGGVGVNLVEASYSIYYSKGFKLEDDLQSEARNYRGGSEIHEKVTRIDIITPGTIDELVTKTLAGKQQVSDKILNWGKELCTFE